MFVGIANDDEEAVSISIRAAANTVVVVRDVTLVFLARGTYYVRGILGAIRRQSAYVVTALRCPARLSTK